MRAHHRTARTIAAGLALTAMIASGAASAQSNLLIILDGSNSMWGRIGGTTKIDIAKSILSDLITKLPQNVQPGLMAYGHRHKNDCSDVELMVPFHGADRTKIIADVRKLAPRGKTPIARSLRKAWSAFKGREEQQNGVVLISDGIETCDADPCQVVRELSKRGIEVRIHTVGFDVGADAEAQLQCIAKAGNGRYFSAEDADGLRQAVQAAQRTVVAPKPQPRPMPKPATYFLDEFEGRELAGHWSVAASDPEGLTVANGELLLVDMGAGDISKETAGNLVQLTGIDLPGGNWTATATVELAVQTAREIATLAVYDGADRFIAADLLTSGNRYTNWEFFLQIRKKSGGKVTRFRTPIARVSAGGGAPLERMAAGITQPIILQLVKRGHSLFARAKQAGKNAPWFETEVLTTLRLKGRLALHLGEYENTDGEAYAHIGRVSIETASQ